MVTVCQQMDCIGADTISDNIDETIFDSECDTDSDVDDEDMDWVVILSFLLTFPPFLLLFHSFLLCELIILFWHIEVHNLKGLLWLCITLAIELDYVKCIPARNVWLMLTVCIDKASLHFLLPTCSY